jgi:hypothetical protein
MQLKCLALKVCRYRVLLLHKDSRAHSSPAGYSRGKRERERPVSNNIYVDQCPTIYMQALTNLMCLFAKGLQMPIHNQS